jgi:transcriptional regulator with XRE-family HTH domain
MQACREKAGLSQDQMAVEMNRSRSCISKYENGHKHPDLPTIMNWVEVTGTKEVLIAFMYGMDGISMIQSILDMAGANLITTTMFRIIGA